MLLVSLVHKQVVWSTREVVCTCVYGVSLMVMYHIMSVVISSFKSTIKEALHLCICQFVYHFDFFFFFFTFVIQYSDISDTKQ